jgi:hypothetical protein
MRAFCNKEYNGECRRCNTLSVAFRPVAHMTSETYIYTNIYYEHCSLNIKIEAECAVFLLFICDFATLQLCDFFSVSTSAICNLYTNIY